MFYKQTDPQWKDEVMTHPKGQHLPDTIGSVGCYLTCYSNILKYKGYDLDPKKLNEIVKQYKGYLYQFDPNTPINKAAFLRVEVLENLYNFKRTVHNNKNLQYEINSFYIAKIKVITKNNSYIHFINVLEDLGNNDLYCFDVYDSKTIKIDKDKILDIYKIEFNI